MNHDYTMKYDRVELRPLTYEDAENMRILRNSNRDRFVTSAEISREAQRAWFEKYLKKNGDCMFSVYHIKTGKWIGAVGIYDINEEAGTAEFGRLLVDKTVTGESGLGTDTTICACSIAFSHIKVKKVLLEVYEDNIPAVRTYLRSGFTEYGETFDDNGKRMILMELSGEEFLRRRNENGNGNENGNA